MEPFNVIYQTAEDGLGDTVKPRLIEAGADLDRVLVIDDSDVQLTLSDERIEKAIIDLFASVVQDDHMVLPTVSIAGSFQRQKAHQKS